jgi:hypothetical protein
LTLLDGDVRGRSSLPTYRKPPGAMGRFFSQIPASEADALGRLTQMVAIAELEAGLVSERTKAALAAAKRKGTKLGNPNLPKASVSGVTSIKRVDSARRPMDASARVCRTARQPR